MFRNTLITLNRSTQAIHKPLTASTANSVRFYHEKVKFIIINITNDLF